MGKERISNGELGLSFDFPLDKEMKKRLPEAQKFVDSEVIKLMSPYTPFRNGKLEQNVTLATDIGSGDVRYTSPYARFQYYGLLMVSETTGSAWARAGEKKILTDIPLKYNTFQHPLAGSFWFERMKKDHIEEIKKGTLEILEGKNNKT